MKLIIISKDPEISSQLPSELSENDQLTIEIMNTSTNPVEIISSVCTEHPTVLLIDDDYLAPNSEDIIKSIKKLCKDVIIIFTTSDESLELGRKISPLGILYYGIKPIDNKDLIDVLNTIQTTGSLT